MATIRDFIYLNVESLYSVYSQAFEGVTASIVESLVGSHESTESPRKLPLPLGSDIETKVIEVSRRTENKFLYDHMYNQLEDRLGNAIYSVIGQGEEALDSGVASSFAVKVSGTAEIEDFHWVGELTSNFNKIGSALHYITTASSSKEEYASLELEERKLRARVEGATDRNERSRAEKALETHKLRAEEALLTSARGRGLGLNERYLADLSYLTALFYPDRLDVTVMAPFPNSRVAFRAVLDKRWLRIDPNMLRSLYGGSATNWTIVGKVTRKSEQPAGSESDSATDTPPNRSLRDAYQDLMRQGMKFEQTFTLSNIREEYILSPLAVYRQQSLD